MIYGISISCDINLINNSSYIRVLLIDNYSNEFLIYESNCLLESATTFSKTDICDETCVLNGIQPQSIKLEIKDATIQVNNVLLSKNPVSDFENKSRNLFQQTQNNKIEKLNIQLQANNMLWRAGETPLSNLSYTQRKALIGDNSFGYEFYREGIFHLPYGYESIIKSNSSILTESFDWRKKHGANNPTSQYYDGDPDYSWNGFHETGNGWMTKVLNQLWWWNCQNTCYVYAPVAALEAVINLYFNQHLNLDLSEQHIISCGSYGCGGGVTNNTYLFFKTNGIVDENCFPRVDEVGSCSNKCINPNYLIKTNGYDIVVNSLDNTNIDIVKQAIIERGPLGVSISGHAEALIGFGVIKEGQIIHGGTGNQWGGTFSIPRNHPLIGSIYWIFKNSVGPDNVDQGYAYLIPNSEYTNASFNVLRAIKLPITEEINNSLQILCRDEDGDGYYNWGIGSKPATCPTCPEERDCDDSNPFLGPYATDYSCSVNCSLFTYNSIPYTVTSNETWEFERWMNKDVIVNSGSTLSIKNNVIFIQNAKLIVKRGAKLIIDGGTLTTNNSCSNSLWQGIQVQGNSTLNQTTESNQGVLELKNNATIENAKIGVLLGSPGRDNNTYNPAYGGGIIRAEAGCTFKNNTTAILFTTYSLSNSSYIYGSQFTTDINYLGTNPITFIRLINVNGVNIKGNTFINSNYSAYNYDKRGQGILSTGSKFTVDDYTLLCITKNKC